MPDPTDTGAGPGLGPASAERIRLIAKAADRTTEIEVFDSRLARVGGQVDRLELDLAPGVYKVLFKVGDAVAQRYATLWPGQARPTTVESPVRFSSAAPLGTTAGSHEYHMLPAMELSRRVDRGPQKGNQLFLFVRDPKPAPGSPVDGLTVHDARGGLVMDCAAEAPSILPLPPGSVPPVPSDGGTYFGCTVELDPGPYLIRVSGDDGDYVEQAIYLCRGWQTQVFLYRQQLPTLEERWRADLAGASVLMTKADGGGFDPMRGDLRLTEIARIALVDERTGFDPLAMRAATDPLPMPSPAVHDDTMDGLLHGKFKNPMLGIYGAHLTLRGAGADHDLLRTVVKNLNMLLGPGHPDVRAVELWLDPNADVGPFDVPPMLRSSWRIILEASLRRPDLVPPHSLTASAGANAWYGGAWLSWKGDDDDQPTAAPRRRPTRLAFSKILRMSPSRWNEMPKPSLTLGGLEAGTAPQESVPVGDGGFQQVADTLASGGREALRRMADRSDQEPQPVAKLVARLAALAGLGEVEQGILGRLYGQFAPLPFRRATPAFFVNQLLEVVGEARLWATGDGLQVRFARIDTAVLDAALRALCLSLGVPRATAAEALAHIYASVSESLRIAPRTYRPPEPGFRALFDGTLGSFLDWRFVGGGGFAFDGGALVAQPGDDFGVLYHAMRFGDHRLRLQFRVADLADDSGVFVRFRDPHLPVPAAGGRAYDKKQWVAVHSGFEVQIDELARGDPPDLDAHRTGAFYGVATDTPGGQRYDQRPTLRPGAWHDMEVTAIGNSFQASIDDVTTSSYDNPDSARGLPVYLDPASGHVGLQCFRGAVAFRNVRLQWVQ